VTVGITSSLPSRYSPSGAGNTRHHTFDALNEEALKGGIPEYTIAALAYS